jgi:hypothetical protein
MSKIYLLLAVVCGFAAACLGEAKPAAQTAPRPSAAPSASIAAPAPSVSHARALDLDESFRARLVGTWTNTIDHLVVNVASVDLATGRIAGTVTPATGPAASNAHELVGWVSGAPVREGYDNVVPVSFSTSLYEYGTLPSWSGFLKDDRLVTMHYLVWPNRPYAWDHVSTFQETWTKLPGAGEWSSWSHDRKVAYMTSTVLADERVFFADYDARRFGAMGCAGCHGAGAANGSYEMPSPDLPKLDATPEGFQALAKNSPRAVEFMRKVVVTRTAQLLGMQRFDMKTGVGFGCFGCHTPK